MANMALRGGEVRGPDAGSGGELAHPVVQGAVHRRGVTDVAHHEVDAGRPRDAVGVARVDGGQQRVQHPHLVTSPPAGGDDVRADEARPSGDSDARDGPR